MNNGYKFNTWEYKIKNLAGLKFGKWTVLDKYEKINDKLHWLCQCDCGSEPRMVSLSNLKSGKTVCCGCVVPNRLSYGEAAFNTLYAEYKRGAIQRHLVFEITKEEFKIITKQNCFYCGAEPKQAKNQKERYGDYVYNGIDRVDNLQGYIINNVVTCCKRCNQGKTNLSQQEFLSWIERVYNYSIKGDK